MIIGLLNLNSIRNKFFEFKELILNQIYLISETKIGKSELFALEFSMSNINWLLSGLYKPPPVNDATFLDRIRPDLL